MKKKERIALFLLRFGLGTFLLLWGIDKIVSPGSTVKIYQFFYFMAITTKVAVIVGIIQVIFSLLIVVGLWKRWTYGIGFIVHLISVLASYKQMFDPFGKNHLFIAGLPVLFAFIALYLLRNQDTLWCLGKGKVSKK